MNFLTGMDWSGWLYGLLAGAIGGGATAVYGAMAATMVDSSDFAFGSPKSLKLMGMMFAMSFIKDAALYLKQNPMPKVVTVTTVETVERQKNPPATVTTRVEETKITAESKDSGIK